MTDVPASETDLFSSITIGDLVLRNRLMRSATAERLSDPETGAPLPALAPMYAALARGGIGLIVTGHACVEPAGKAHPQMSSIAADDLIPVWRETIRPAQDAGARVILQVNYAGASCDPAVTPSPIAPSGVPTNELVTPGVMTTEDIRRVIRAFGQAARRARESGFDGVQLHGAHGYLVTQFLSPFTNRRDDEWGGNPERRRAFVEAVLREMRSRAGDDFPLWIKLGVAGRPDSGLTLEAGATVAAACTGLVDCIEISQGLGAPPEVDDNREARFLPLAAAVRRAVGSDFPLALVNGFSTGTVMQEVLDSGLVQLISLCRPLVAEPDLPAKIRADREYRAACDRCGQCWPTEPDEGVGCHNPTVLEYLDSIRVN